MKPVHQDYCECLFEIWYDRHRSSSRDKKAPENDDDDDDINIKKTINTNSNSEVENGGGSEASKKKKKKKDKKTKKSKKSKENTDVEEDTEPNSQVPIEQTVKCISEQKVQIKGLTDDENSIETDAKQEDSEKKSRLISTETTTSTKSSKI